MFSTEILLSFIGIGGKNYTESVTSIMKILGIQQINNIYTIKENQILALPGLLPLNIPYTIPHLPFRKLFEQICEHDVFTYIKLMENIRVDIVTYPFAFEPLLNHPIQKEICDLSVMKSKYIKTLYSKLPYESNTYIIFDVNAYINNMVYVVRYQPSVIKYTMIRACNHVIKLFGKIPIRNVHHLHAALFRNDMILTDWTNITLELIRRYLEIYPHTKDTIDKLQKISCFDEDIYFWINYYDIYKQDFMCNIQEYCIWILNHITHMNRFMFSFLPISSLLEILQLSTYLQFILNHNCVSKNHIWKLLDNVANIQCIGVGEYLIQRKNNEKEIFEFDFEEYWMLQTTHIHTYLTECFTSRELCMEYITHPLYKNSLEYPLDVFSNIIQRNNIKNWEIKLACFVGCDMPVRNIPPLFSSFFLSSKAKILDGRYIHKELICSSNNTNIVHTFSYHKKEQRKLNYKTAFPFAQCIRIHELIYEWASYTALPLLILLDRTIKDKSLHDMMAMHDIDLTVIDNTHNYCQNMVNSSVQLLSGIQFEYINNPSNILFEQLLRIFENDIEEYKNFENTKHFHLFFEQLYSLDEICRKRIIAHARMYPQQDQYEIVKVLVEFEAQRVHTFSILLIAHTYTIEVFKNYHSIYYTSPTVPSRFLSVSLPLYGTIFSFLPSYNHTYTVPSKITTIELLACLVQLKCISPYKIAQSIFEQGSFTKLYYDALEFRQDRTGNSIFHICIHERIALLFDCNTLTHMNTNLCTPWEHACNKGWKYAKFKYRNWMLREDHILIRKYIEKSNINIHTFIDTSIQIAFVKIALQWPESIQHYKNVFQLYIGVLINLIEFCYKHEILPSIDDISGMNMSDLHLFFQRKKKKMSIKNV
jgi:hypothetical protein